MPFVDMDDKDDDEWEMPPRPPVPPRQPPLQPTPISTKPNTPPGAEIFAESNEGRAALLVLFKKTIHKKLHQLSDGSTKSKTQWINFAYESFENGGINPGPLAGWIPWKKTENGKEAINHNKFRNLIVNAAQYIADGVEEKRQTEGDDVSVSSLETYAVEIAAARKQLKDTVANKKSEKAAKTQRKILQEDFMGLVGTGKGVLPPTLTANMSQLTDDDFEALSNLGVQPQSKTDRNDINPRAKSPTVVDILEDTTPPSTSAAGTMASESEVAASAASTTQCYTAGPRSRMQEEQLAAWKAANAAFNQVRKPRWSDKEDMCTKLTQKIADDSKKTDALMQMLTSALTRSTGDSRNSASTFPTLSPESKRAKRIRDYKQTEHALCVSRKDAVEQGAPDEEIKEIDNQIKLWRDKCKNLHNEIMHE